MIWIITELNKPLLLSICQLKASMKALMLINLFQEKLLDRISLLYDRDHSYLLLRFWFEITRIRKTSNTSINVSPFVLRICNKLRSHYLNLTSVMPSRLWLGPQLSYVIKIVSRSRHWLLNDHTMGDLVITTRAFGFLAREQEKRKKWMMRTHRLDVDVKTLTLVFTVIG